MVSWIAGVDGCPKGWIAALAPADDVSRPRIVVVETLDAVLDAPEAPTVVAVDIPIGLPDRVGPGGRAAERAVRPLLGARKSSVFSVPARAAVEAPDYPAACAAARAASDPPRALSKQCYHLFPRIREVDRLLRSRRDLIGRVREVHPERAFRRLNGERPLDHPKKRGGRPDPLGVAERRALLVAGGIAPEAAHAAPPRGAGLDDLLDALADLLIARRVLRGEAEPHPNPPERDAHGLPIAIWA